MIFASSFSFLHHFGQRAQLYPVLRWLVLGMAAFLLARGVALLTVPVPAPNAMQESAGQNEQAATEAATNAIPPRSDFASVERNNLFDVKSHNAPAANAPPPPKPVFTGVLMGTMDGTDSAARIIVLFQGQQHILAVGQSLAGFTLVSINRRTAIFEGNGVSTTLSLDQAGALQPIILP